LFNDHFHGTAPITGAAGLPRDLLPILVSTQPKKGATVWC
jgi:hypothetical protein